jgi:hypothetical protein
VPFKYQDIPASGELRQGEILADVYEYRLVESSGGAPGAPELPAEFDPILHAFTIVMTPDCDLLTDFNRRLEGDLAHNAILHHVLLCDIFKEDEIRSRVAPGRDIWKSITGNQNERYHYLPAGKIGDDICQDCGSEALMALISCRRCTWISSERSPYPLALYMELLTVAKRGVLHSSPENIYTTSSTAYTHF